MTKNDTINQATEEMLAIYKAHTREVDGEMKTTTLGVSKLIEFIMGCEAEDRETITNRFEAKAV